MAPHRRRHRDRESRCCIRPRHERLRQTEVHQLRPGLGQHDVARFQIAVRHPAAVRLFESFTNLDSVLQNLRHRQRPLAQTVRQSLALQVFHHQVVDAILAADIVQSADVGMVQRRNRARFPIEALLGLGVLGKMRGKNLDGDSSIEPRVPRPIHLSHPARPERRLNLIWTESRARGKPHVCAQLYSMLRLPWRVGILTSRVPTPTCRPEPLFSEGKHLATPGAPFLARPFARESLPLSEVEGWEVRPTPSPQKIVNHSLYFAIYLR